MLINLENIIKVGSKVKVSPAYLTEAFTRWGYSNEQINTIFDKHWTVIKADTLLFAVVVCWMSF